MRVTVVVIAAAAALLGAACAGGHGSAPTAAGVAPSTTAAGPATTTAPPTSGSHTADVTKLPIGDHKYATSPTKGDVYSCITQFNGGGAFRDGPWIHTDSATWDSTAKIAVNGSVTWDGHFTETAAGGGETLNGNGLPTAPTG